MPAKKKMGALGWLAIGCLAFIILAGIGFTTCTYFVGKKVKDFAEDVEDNPERLVERLIELNPDLEVVETHEDGKVTIRERETGKQITVDWSDITSGNISFESDEGSVDIGADGVTVTDKEGDETAYGADANQQIPDWVPVVTGIDPNVLMSASDTGLYIAESTSNHSTLAGLYQQRMQTSGFELTTTEAPDSTTLQGRDDANDRTLVVWVGSPDSGEGSAVRVNWDGS